MPENVSSIIYKFSQEVKRMLGEKLTKVIVYGSYARGDYRDNSCLLYTSDAADD